MPSLARTGAMLVVLAAIAVLTLAVSAPAAQAAFGDNYGIADINDGDGPAQEVPAYAGQQEAFWAGACDIIGAPAPGEPIPGGIGSRPLTIPVANYGNVFTPSTIEQAPAPSSPPNCIDWGFPNQQCPGASCAPSGTATPHPWQPGYEPSWRLASTSQAGSHPDGTATFAVERNGFEASASKIIPPDGSPDNIRVDLPPGFVGDPTALPKCSAEQFAVVPHQCPPASQIGVSSLVLTTELKDPEYNTYPVYNLEPRKGYTAEFGIPNVLRFVSVRIVAEARTNSDFGVTAMVTQIPATLPLLAQSVTLWGIPWAAEHDIWRLATELSGRGFPETGLPPAEQAHYDPSWGAIKPFFSNITGPANPAEACDGTGSEPNTRLMIDTFQHPGARNPEGDPDLSDPDWVVADAPAPALTGCEKVPFAADIELAPTSRQADAATGLDVDLSVPQNDEPPFPPPASGAGDAETDQYVQQATDHWRSDAGLATSHLRDTVVTLPQGVSVNPSGATGLQGCSDAQVGVRQHGNPPLFNDEDPFDNQGAECPSGSVIGSVTADTPVLEQPLTGQVVLGTPKSTDPQSGEMFRMFLVMRNKARGLIAKIYGSAVADPATGQLTATFERNPQVPVENIDLDLKDGSKGLLALPQRCSSPAWSSLLTGWSKAQVDDGGAFAINARCGFGFSPTLVAGMDTQEPRGNGTFSFRFGRSDGEQWLRGLTAKLPTGLLASVKHVELCTDAEANAGACPLASQVGVAHAKAGSGDPLVLERPGRVYLTEGYKGGEYGLAVDIRPIAGPFRGANELSPIIVRQALHVDRTTAQVTAVSDPFPLIHHGVPLRARELTVKMDRDGFMLNPSSCEPKQVSADILSAEGTVAKRATHFQAKGCKELRFKPRLRMRLVGRRQAETGGHPAVRARVRQSGTKEAGIEKAVVRLPRSLALDPDNAQALCEFEDGTKPDVENRCPDGSIVGRARATSPLLKDDLVGNVYFVKNVRIDEETGNEIRTLPMIIVALRGEISINLVGESSVDRRNRLVNTFANVPDAPISKFNLNIKGGRNGILTVTRTERGEIDLCDRPRSHVAQADMDGHNGERFDRNVRLDTPCPKKRKARIKVGKTRWNGGADKLRVTGRVSPGAKRKVRVTVRCGKTRVSRAVKPNRRGFFKRTLPTGKGRCDGAGKARVIVRYTGDRRFTPVAKRQRVRKA